MQYYPIKGPHNGGWDPALEQDPESTYSCPPHPASSPDNSDFSQPKHPANDLFAAIGTPVVAVTDGTLVEVVHTTGTKGGKHIILQDACGWHYRYAHLDSIEPGLQVGSVVTAGQLLGTVGKTGSASITSPHVHFSIYLNKYSEGIDPFPYLQQVDHTSCQGTTY